MTSHRSARVADLVRRELARLLREEVRDQRIGFVTVTEVRLSPDLRHAKVYLTLLDPSGRDAALAALSHATPFLRRSLARSLSLRYTPELRFVHDPSLDSGLRIERLLDESGTAPDDPQDSDE